MKRIALATMLLAGCTDVTPTPPVSLDGPTAVAVARGRVCVDLFAEGDAIIPSFGPCAEGRSGAIGLVVNEQSDRVSFVALDRSEPRLLDLRHSVPGVTHLPVGRLPVDVAVSADGATAYTLNQMDGDLSIINLWKPAVDAQRIGLPSMPIALETRPGTAQVLVAAGSPSVLWRREGATCETTGCTLPDDGGIALPLPGTVTDFAVSPQGHEAYVAYRDLDFISVVDLETMTVSASVGAAPSCADGIDNDGDGKADANDANCFGPFDAEAPGLAGHAVAGACNDGLDNDEDGLLDREDPDCITALSDEISAEVNVRVATCNDGRDNDGDGKVDYPEDPDCFGPYGSSELTIDPVGFDAVDVDDLGLLVYLVDRARNQVVVVDAQNRRVIDAAASAEPSLGDYTNTIGIAVAPTPLDVSATVRRDCLTRDNVAVPCSTGFFDGTTTSAPYDDDEVVVRYALGAWVAEDTGRLRYVEAMDLFCRVPTEEVRANLNSAFVEPAALEGTTEAKCLRVPSFPLTAREDYLGTCEAPCADCDTTLLSERFFCQEGTGVLVNPHFGLVDVLSSEARTSGKSQCEIPADVDAQMRDFASQPGVPTNFRCTSQLLPQPIATQASGLDPDGFPSLDSLERADLIQTSQSYLGWNADGQLSALDFTRPADERLSAESWTVTYEGVLPATQRTDGLLSTELALYQERNVVAFDAGPLDLCRAGVQVGDRLTLLESPADAEGCEAFAGDVGFLTFEVVAHDASDILLGIIDEEGYAAELPTRTCFPRGLSYRVQPHDAWVVVGDRSGLISGYENVFGECVARQNADGRLTDSRVKTGETYEGPYFSFYLWPGPHTRDASGQITAERAIPPQAGLSYTFAVQPNFYSRSFVTEGVFPAHVLAYQRGAYYRVLSTDPNSNFLFYKDARSSSEIGTRLR